MPRVSKRKSEPVRSSEPAAKKTTKEVERIDSFFATYANTSIDMIDPEGVEKLCADLNIEYTDIKVLVLAWKLNAKKQGYFTQDEWRTGLKSLHVDTLKKLQKQLPELVKEAFKKEKFEDFYHFSFRYCLTEDKQKNLDIETTCELLKLLLHSLYDQQVDSFIEFLKIQKEYKVINMDQWTNFYRFCQEIDFPDFKNYDDGLAWPIILDNFVVWLREEKFA
ncbi:putative defective-in-cullin neddylation protein [Helianthus anomalus]